jgi:hypothetical protein
MKSMLWRQAFVTIWLIFFSLIKRKMDIGQGFIPKTASGSNRFFYACKKESI